MFALASNFQLSCLLFYRLDEHSIMQRTHSALFMGAYSVLYLNWSTHYTVQKITQHIGDNLSNFCDYNGSYEYQLCIHDCLEGIHTGVQKHGWFTMDGVNQLKYGLNMNWVMPNKVIAMKDPKSVDSQGNVGLNRKYVKELLRNKVDYVIRLNGKDFEQDAKYGRPYPLEEFFAQGIAVCDIPLKDGGVPTEKQLDLFLEICSIPESQVAIHCHAGMGRTGTMIGCYLIRDYEFTSRQAVAWLNLCRRGSVMGKQHGFLDRYYDGLIKARSSDPVEQTLERKDESVKGTCKMGEEKVKNAKNEDMEPKRKKARLEEEYFETEVL